MRVFAQPPMGELERFLHEHMDPATSQYPEFVMGWASLSRTRMIHLMGIYGIPVPRDETGSPISKEKLMPLLNAWWEEGRFKKMAAGPPNYVSWSIGDLRKEVKRREMEQTPHNTRTDLAAMLAEDDVKEPA